MPHGVKVEQREAEPKKIEPLVRPLVLGSTRRTAIYIAKILKEQGIDTYWKDVEVDRIQDLR